MATPEQYAQWIVANKDKQGTPEFNKVAEAYRITKTQSSEPAEVPRETQSQPSQFQDDLVSNPLTRGVAEFGSGVAEGINQLGDFFLTKPGNEILGLLGYEKSIPPLAGSKQFNQEFLEPGLTRDVVRTSGEMVAPGAAVGGALRTASKAVPALLSPSQQTLGQALTKQMGTSTAAQDVGYSALSGVGAETGEEFAGDTGKMVGAFMAPMAGATVKPALSSLIKSGKQGIENLLKPLSTMSDEGASKLLAEAMVREGLSPDDITKRLAELGPEAIPADVGINFSRLLRTASNKIPRIEGQAAEVLKARQSGQGNRLLSAFDDATGTPSLTVDDEIARLNDALKPEINRLYSEAGSKGINVSKNLRTLLEGKSSIGKAQKKAQQRLADKRAAGDEITQIDIIDATKQELDDQIGKSMRQGANNKARDLIRLKNIMVNEADTAIPEYKQARDMFAGKASMENAAQSGEMFLKMKPSDLKNLTRTYGESERKMFKLGAKQAILDKIDDLQANADAVKRIFGKNGDVKKLRNLFDDKKSFNQFADTLEREANFIQTRNAAQANSTTAKQLADEESAFNVLSDTAQAVTNPRVAAGLVGRIMSGLGKGKKEAAYTEALEKAGDILLVKGIEPKRIQSILKLGNQKQIQAVLDQALKKPNDPVWSPAAVTGATLTGE